MNADLKQYLKLKAALRNEQARIETRLAEIAKVLGGEVAGAVVSTAKRGGRRTFSAATKARMAAAQQARWAKLKGTSTSTTATTPAPKKKRKMSAAGRSAIKAAATQARWAKIKAAKAAEAKPAKPSK